MAFPLDGVGFVDFYDSAELRTELPTNQGRHTEKLPQGYCALINDDGTTLLLQRVDIDKEFFLGKLRCYGPRAYTNEQIIKDAWDAYQAQPLTF